MEIFQVLILAVLEGLTEFLPVSSTGHLILASRILNLGQTDFIKSFEIFIQLGAITSVALLYFQRFLKDKKLAGKVLLAFAPSAILGVILYPLIKTNLLGNAWVTVVALVSGGVMLIILDAVYKPARKKGNTATNTAGYTQVLVIGVFQILSMIPGVSRAGATIVGGLLVGLTRKNAVEFSFLLSIPTMLGAVGLDMVKSSFAFSTQEWLLLWLGFGISFLVALLTVKLFLQLSEKISLAWFGVYRILAGLAFWLIFLQ